MQAETQEMLAGVFRKPTPGPRCWYPNVNSLKVAEVLEYVEAKMQEGTIPVWRSFSEMLTKLGLDVSDQALRHHYQGRCRCGK